MAMFNSYVKLPEDMFSPQENRHLSDLASRHNLSFVQKTNPQIHGWIIFRSEASQFGVYLIFGQTNADYLPSGNLNIAMDVVG